MNINEWYKEIYDKLYCIKGKKSMKKSCYILVCVKGHKTDVLIPTKSGDAIMVNCVTWNTSDDYVFDKNDLEETIKRLSSSYSSVMIVKLVDNVQFKWESTLGE